MSGAIELNERHIMNIKQAMTVSAITAAFFIAIPSVGLADDDKVDMASVVLNMQDAITIELDRVAGEVVEVELESEDDKVVWEIEVMGENDQVSEVSVDANTGVIIEVEVDDD